MAPITKCTKIGTFAWTTTDDKAFRLIKKHLTKAPVFRLLNFELLFDIACDASHVGIGRVLSQQGHLVSFFNKKLNKTRHGYFTYDLELYAIVQSLRYWRHNLIHWNSILYSDLDSLWHIQFQKHLNTKHARWVIFYSNSHLCWSIKLELKLELRMPSVGRWSC